MRKAWIPFALSFAAGSVLLGLLLPAFGPAQPHGLSVTLGEARRLADVKAAEMGIPLEKTWPIVTWDLARILEKPFSTTPGLRERAEADPALSPRLGSFEVVYYPLGREKGAWYGTVSVSRTGEIQGARRALLPEDPGARPDPVILRPVADAFVAKGLPGAPGPVFNDVRPTALANRTDHVFRYRVTPRVEIPGVALYVRVFFNGTELAGWDLHEEYLDGSPFKFDSSGNILAVFGRYALVYGLLAALLVVFLRKYHAGEVGVRAGSALFLLVLAGLLVSSLLTARLQASDFGLGNIDVLWTSVAVVGFRLLFYDLPISVLVFLAWTVGESYARERWGDRLASFDALLRRDPVNATVGGSLLCGLLAAPSLAAATLLAPWIGVRLGVAHPVLGNASLLVLCADGGPLYIVVGALIESFLFAVVGLLFVLAAASRRRLLPLGVLAAVGIGMVLAVGGAPVGPFLVASKLAFGAPLAAALVFLATDLLAATTALFGGSLLVGLLPLLGAVSGAPRTGIVAALLAPGFALLGLALAGLATRRRIAYAYDDLAPHVKRIAERERIKAEIDAANRIQAALLPSSEPDLPNTSVASHYQSATEIGGDYFDFLLFDDGEVGIAFGDVSGHGLTSGIVMAMAKSALLVQVDHDRSPRRVLTVLNDIVIRTAPKRILMTFFYGVLRPDSGELRFASAGHLDPYVFRAETRTLEPLSAWGFPLGVKRREPFQEVCTTFGPGDRLILYSDGLIEALNDDGEPFGFERFEEVLLASATQGAPEIRGALLASVKRFTRNRPPEDDQTLVVLSFEDVATRAKVA